MIDQKLVAVQEDSRVLQDHKGDIQQLEQLQLIQLHLSLQIKHQEVVIIIRTKLRTISQQVHLGQLVILRNVHQLDHSVPHKVETLLVSLIQVHKDLLVYQHSQALKLLLVHLIHLLFKLRHKDQQAQVPNVHQLLDHQQVVLLHRNQDQQLQDSDQATREVEAVVAVDHLLQANKMKARKATTLLFPENQKLTIRSSQKFLKHLSIATNKNFQDITLMLKPVAKFSTFAL